MNLKKILIVLGAIAVLLGVAAVFVVFYNPAISVIPGAISPSSTSLFSLTKRNAGAPGNATSTASAFLGNSASGGPASSTENQSGTPQFSSTYAWPYPLQWTEGQSTLVIAGAAIEGNQLMLAITTHIGGQPECVPVNVRLVADEAGTLESPMPTQFSFPDTNSCTGTPNTTYDPQAITFTLGPDLQPPFLLTTGGASNIFFEVATTTDGAITITLPATTD